MIRRRFLQLMGVTGVAALAASCNRINSTVGTLSSPTNLVRFPEKTELMLLTDRPPQLETPIHYFRQDLTPNEAFFVRWHLEGIPISVDLRTFRLNVGGHVRQPLQLSVDELQSQFEPISIIAVNQCSGNSRSFFEPRVPGGQWKHGAVGNAKWTGVPVKSILDRAQLKSGAVDVSFNGLDVPPLPSVSDFVKALSIDHARDGDVMIAYAMNDQSLPMVNGFPLRLVVPGWYGTYWVKALSDITVLPQPFSNFWTDKAYRIPNAPNGTEFLRRIWPRTQFRLTNSTCVPYSFVPTPMKSCIPECRLKLRASLSTQGTGFDEWRCRRTEEPTGQMLDWIRKLESTPGDAGGCPGHQETAGSIDSWLARQMRWEKLRARNSGTAVVLCGM